MKMIIHADINNFYASVECLLNPKLASLPLAVAGNIETRSGIILAKNYLAKQKGVSTGEAIWQAKQKCPNLVTVLPNFSVYRHYSRVVMSIYEQYTDKIECMGLDECWLDMTDSLHLFVTNKHSDWFEQGKEFACLLQKEVEEKTGLGISIGVSFNKLFSKMGSDMKKPKGITVISADNYKQIVYPCPVRDILGVGSKTEKALQKFNIQTLGELVAANTSVLKKRFGVVATDLQQTLLGFGSDEVGVFAKAPPPKSVGNGTTLVKDSTNPEEIFAVISMLCSQIAMRLREQKLAATCISVTVKTNEFEHFRQEKSIAYPTDDETEIALQAKHILSGFWNYKTPIRSIRVATTRLVSTKEAIQLSLFQKNCKRQINQSIDIIRQKYDYSKIKTAKSMTAPRVSHSFD